MGTLALCGFPLFSGFWSKDAILHAAYGWSLSRVPFYLGAIGALLTAFYMTRQVCYVFFSHRRRGVVADPVIPAETASVDTHDAAHESPATMTVPLAFLAVFAVLFGLLGTPAWPWLQGFLDLQPATFDLHQLLQDGVPQLMLISSLLVFAGLGLGWWFYGRPPHQARGRRRSVAISHSAKCFLHRPSLRHHRAASRLVDCGRLRMDRPLGLGRHSLCRSKPDQGDWDGSTSPSIAGSSTRALTGAATP